MATLQSISKNKKTALICEDDPDLNEAIRQFLMELDFDVKCTFDGKEAVGLIQAAQYDLIIMDFRIPSMNGLQVCAVARATPLNRATKIYVVTGDVDPSLEARAQALQVNRFLRKPFKLTFLEKCIVEDFTNGTESFAYDPRIINVFLGSAAEIYKFYFQELPGRGNTSIQRGTKVEQAFCTGRISFTGAAAGSMGLVMTKPFIKQLADILFAGMNVDFDQQFLADVTGEMCNQVIGKVKDNFSTLGIPITIGLPEVIMGDSQVIPNRVSSPLIAIPMGKQNALFELQFVLSPLDLKLNGDFPSSVPMFE